MTATLASLERRGMRHAVSPFPRIEDYAFLSDCHTGALVAPDGTIDWLCVPSFDSPSIFGSLVDREAGDFRFGPYGINHPTSRAYIPGTNVLETTYWTPSGWVRVADALTIGPRGPDDAVTPHRRPPTDQDADRAIVGEMQRATELMERLLRVVSPLGLFAEEFDVQSGRHLGNFPQAFSHLALIEAAGRIILTEHVEEIT